MDAILYHTSYKSVGEALASGLESVAKIVRNARGTEDLRQAQNHLKFCLQSLEREEARCLSFLMAFMYQEEGKECGFHGFALSSNCSGCNGARV